MANDDELEGDELVDRRNKKRFFRRAADINLSEAEHLLSSRLVELLKEAPGDLSTEQRAFLPILIKALGDVRDQLMAAQWGEELKQAILRNPRTADMLPAVPAVRKLGAMAAKVVKAGKGDGREQSERAKRKADKAILELYGPEALDDAPPPPAKKRADDLLSGLGDA